MSVSPLSPDHIPLLRRSLLGWYQHHGRSLPWRQTQDPYAIWISEIMLQQTQVKTVLPYYDRWLTHFPTIASLAAADLQQVLKVWQGLGYYARARNLHHAAQQIMTQHGGNFPRSYAATIALPGIGQTTAGGILSAAFNQAVPILDGNVKRILARLLALDRPVRQSVSRLWDCSATLLDPQHPRMFNQAIMDLGATCCTPKNPQCAACPWQFACTAYNLGSPLEFPVKEETAPLPHKRIGVAVIWNDQRQVLIDRRPPKGLLGGLWEFPGGKVEPGETIEACIRREIQEEIGLEIEVGSHLITVDHAYTHFKVRLEVYHCYPRGGEPQHPQAIECDEVRWVSVGELEQFPFPKANLDIIKALQIECKVST